MKDLGKNRNLPLPKRNQRRGFSLLEMTISLTIFMIVGGTILLALAAYERSYQGVQIQGSLDQSMRAALEEIAQEVGQSGSMGVLSQNGYTATGTLPVLGAAVSASAAAQSVAVSGGSNFFVNEKVLVDLGTSQEEVKLTAVTASSMSAIFTLSHASGVPVVPVGVYADGILPPTGTTSGSTITASTLNFYGDILGDGTTVEVKYTCDLVNNVLTRKQVPYPNPGGAAVVTSTLLSNVTACSFVYSLPTSYTISNVTYTFYPSVSLAITAQSTGKDPRTAQPVTITREMGDIQPRNLVMGLSRASVGDDSRLQQDPTGTPAVPLL